MHKTIESPHALVDLYPPKSAERDEVQFSHWVREIGQRLLNAGLGNVSIIPMLTKSNTLMVGIEAAPELALRIKQLAYS
jgi:hypothetical protein